MKKEGGGKMGKVDPRRHTKPYPEAKPTHYECVCGGSCDGPRGHDLCERLGKAKPCYCDLWKKEGEGK